MLEDCLEHEIEALDDCSLEDLREIWRARCGSPPPKLRSPTLLRHLIAWRLQADVYGGLDSDTRRKLNRHGPVQAEGLSLGPGAIIRKDWQGQTIEVVVAADGFRWNEQHFRSLSAVARAATGTQRNGPRFFGLRDDST